MDNFPTNTTEATPPADNPYVGPRPFTREEEKLYFGREREGRELLSLVVSQRLVLFYAQSGAGKSSLINTQLIPGLESRGFVVLPVGRVGGELLAGSTAQVDNVYRFNLMLRLDQSQGDPARLTHLSLSTFLAQLTTDDGVHWYYAGEAANEPVPTTADRESEANANSTDDPQSAIRNPQFTPPNYVLIIDQFEEIFTTHSDRWREREAFFIQLDEAMRQDPSLWVVLSLREDFVASLDPYAHFMSDKLRARYYMQRMGIEAAEKAIAEPVVKSIHPFASGVARQLVDNLRRIRIQGQSTAQYGQYVEPVQLQVVCLQLWENLRQRPPGPITGTDLQKAGDVDQALADYYEESLHYAKKKLPTLVNEATLRRWFSQRLITESGTRGMVNQGDQWTGEIRNEVVELLDKERYVVRQESRAGSVWVELTHDRFVEPIIASNQRWFAQQSPPRILSFEIVPTVITSGAHVRLSWEVEESDYVIVEPQGLQFESKHEIQMLLIEQTISIHLQAVKQGLEPVQSELIEVIAVKDFDVSYKADLVARTRTGQIVPVIGRALIEHDLFGEVPNLEQEWIRMFKDADSPVSIHQLLGPRNELSETSQRKAEYVRSLKERLIAQHASTLDLSSAPNSISQIIDLLPLPKISASPLSELAALPLSIYITTSYHTLIESYLQRYGKEPILAYPAWNTERTVQEQEQLAHIATPAKPLVFHLFGIDQVPESLVITEEDHLNFLMRIRSDKDVIPLSIRYTFTRIFNLIVGFDRQSWELRSLLLGLADPYQHRRIGGLFQLSAQKGFTIGQVRYLQEDLAKHNLEIYWNESEALIPLLKKDV